MPKAQRKTMEVEAVKDEILDQAVQIMFEEGFEGLSMRKLASAMGMTAANIYNYYRSKDEIYLAIQKQGFELLHSLFAQVAGLDIPPVEKLRRMARVYVTFGLEEVAYYEVMFNRHGPKYADYKNTPMEPLALAEKMAALQVLGEAESVAGEVLAEIGGLEDKDVWQHLMQAWLLLHGYVALYNNRTLHEVEEQPAVLIESILNTLTGFAIHQR
ncbi:MAG: TetR/AcrR family transcriptional regulator [Desulfatibacillum sp.]|nr:TetR/AcrR family transcriptional regulator [Desulfatibacillum sp.]